MAYAETVDAYAIITKMVLTMNDASRYDALLEAGREPPPPCPVCTGEEDAEPCGEDCEAIFLRCKREKQIRGLYEAAWKALEFARVYNATLGPQDYRVKAVLRTVYLYRQDIAELRAA